jgi:hypothetical protein
MNQIVPTIDKEGRRFLVTSHSIDGTFESCPRRFEFRHLYQQFPLLESSGLAADVGTALHEAVQEWTRCYSFERAAMTLMRWWPWELEEKRKQAGFKPDYARTLGNALMLLEKIIKHKFWDSWEVARLPDGSPAIELAWRINHTSLGSFKSVIDGTETFIATQGKIDWILRHKVTGELRVTDLKTTILDEALQMANFRFSGQAGQYGLVLSQAIGHDWHTHGMDVCYFVAEFGEHGFPEANPMEHHLDPMEIYEAIEAKNERLERMISMGQKGFWPRRAHGCVFYQKPCGFIDVCHRRDPEFLTQWFEDDRDHFSKESRVYEPYWIVEA